MHQNNKTVILRFVVLFVLTTINGSY